MRLIVTAAPPGAARRLAREALSRRLAACVNSASIASTYWWKGKIEHADERLLIFKTTPERASTLFDFIERHHPYDVPEIAELDASRLNEPYRRYLTETLAPPSRARAPRRSSRRRG
jgi:periplasmic divalent cation tolerance protein